MTEPLASPWTELATLRARCDYWQRVLRLQDWDFDIRLLRRSALKNGYASAEISVYRRAVINLLDPADIEADAWPVDHDLENSLVHELLHCVYYDAGRPKEDTPEDRGLERAIEATAMALVALDRQRPAS